MPQPRRRRHGPQPDRRRAPELLAASRDGATEAIMIAHGFTFEQMVEPGSQPRRRSARFKNPGHTAHTFSRAESPGRFLVHPRF